MAHIYVTRKIPQIGITMLEAAGHTVVVSQKDGVLTKAELIAALSEYPYDAILSLLTDPIDGEILAAAPNAKIVANYAVGFNNFDLAAFKERGIIATNTPGVLTDTVAEFTVALIMAITKRIPEADRYTRQLRYQGWAPELLLGMDLKGKTLGLVGAGRIGSGVAERVVNGLGMRVIYHDVAQNEAMESAVACTFIPDLAALLAEADVVSVHVPLLDTTHHLINRERLAQMKPSAYLINTSRGPVVDEVALVEALQHKSIRGAAIDVFEHEPNLAYGLPELENVIITPHIASASEETRSKMSEIAAANLIAVLSGQSALNPVTE